MKSSIVIFFMLIGAHPIFAAGPCVLAGRGHFQIHTGTAGLFGTFAHDHLIEGQKIEGCASIDANDVLRSSIKLTFTTANIRVLDPKESASDRDKIQKTMETDVLRISEYPQVIFESTGIDRGDAADGLRIRGNLTIRGHTESVTIPIKWSRLDDGTYRATGEYTFKQTTFGIKPVQLAGGTVKVKDEVKTEFELFLK